MNTIHQMREQIVNHTAGKAQHQGTARHTTGRCHSTANRAGIIKGEQSQALFGDVETLETSLLVEHEPVWLWKAPSNSSSKAKLSWPAPPQLGLHPRKQKPVFKQKLMRGQSQQPYL